MNFPFFVARRYLFSKKSTHAINVISGISAVGVAVATMALVVTLSVFNGFHDLVATFFTNFDPQLKVTPVKGKTAPADDPILTQIRQMPEVEVSTETVEDMALATYNGRQAMVIIKGVEDNFDSLTHIKDIVVGNGDFELHAADMHYGIPGIRLAETLQTGYTYKTPLKIYAPKREGQLNMANPEDGFVEDELYSPGVVFMVKQAKYDKNHILTSIAFARNLFAQQGMLSSLEMRLKPGSDFESVKQRMQQVAGDKYRVCDRFEQQEDSFRMMQIEKWMTFLILTFILAIALFNVVGSLSMLMIEKQADVATLRNLGADNRLIRRIFLLEGWMISAFGAGIGIVIGVTLCLLQQTFGFISLGDAAGAFVIDAYPVRIAVGDIVTILCTVLLIGFLAAWYPVRYLAKRFRIEQ